MHSKVLMLHQLVVPLERRKPRRVRVIDVFGMDRYQDGSLYIPFDLGDLHYPIHVDTAQNRVYFYSKLASFQEKPAPTHFAVKFKS
jgi:hypothetical protein